MYLRLGLANPKEGMADGALNYFKDVAIRPGKPILFSKLNAKTAFFGLPGNSVSTAACFRFFVLPYIFQDRAHIERVLNGPVGKKVSEKLFADTGVHLLTFGGVFFRDMYSVE